MRHTCAPVLLAFLALALVTPASSGRSRDSRGELPPETLRGPIDRLRQYPVLSLATAAQRAAAQELLDHSRLASRAWVVPVHAAAAGYSTRTRTRRPGDRTVHYLHAEHLGYTRDRRYLDPQHPEVLIYANASGRDLVLVGLMYAMRRGMHGRTPGGPITRWHRHLVCVKGAGRGLAPRPDGSCPRGQRLRLGVEMLHIWFTNDLRSAFAIHAPEPELCAARLLPSAYCRGVRSHSGHHPG